MTVPKINSSHGSETRNIINAAIDSINVQGKSIQNLVARGQLTPGQYATLIETVNGLIAKGEVDLDDLSPEILKKFSEVSPEFNLLSIPRDKSVTPVKTTFMQRTKNLFDGTYHKINVYIPTDGPVFSRNNSENRRMGIVPIQPNKTYTITIYGEADKFRVATTGELQFGENGQYPLGKPLLLLDPTFRQFTFTNNAVDSFLYIYVSDQNKEPKMQVEEGEEATPYVPGFSFDSDFMPVEFSESTRKITNELTSLSLMLGTQFSKLEIPYAWELGTLGLTNGHKAPSNFRIRTADYIYLEGGTYIGLPEDSRYSLRVYEFNRDEAGSYNFESPGEFAKSYTATKNLYAKVLIAVDDTTDMMPHLTIAPYELTGFKKLTDSDADENIGLGDSYLAGDFDKFYVSRKMEDVSTGSDFILVESNHTDIYSRYDNLMNANPGHISKKLLGHATGVDGNPDTSLPIYEYHFKNPMDYNNLNQTPKVLILNGVHGGEKSTIWSTLKFFENMLEFWQEDETLEALKSNIDFKVIPILNPAGYNAHTRKNARDVDLNRNFGWKWGPGSSDPGNWEYKGESAFSELESQIADAWFRDNKDAFALIDFHNTMYSNIYSYMTSHVEAIEKSYSSLIRRLYNHWYKTYGIDMSQQTREYLAKNYYNMPIASNHAGEEVGIKNSSLLEVSQYDQARNNLENTGPVIERGIEILINHLLLMLKNFKY